MRDLELWSRLVGLFVAASIGVPHAAAGQDVEAAPMRGIPGITADDAFPEACVSCHVVLPDGMDARISTLMEHWRAEVDSTLLARARAAAPPDLKLVGTHPDAEESLRSIPGACLTCHARGSTLAPPFGRLMHRIHLVGGETNHFLTMFRGECTYCHKLDSESGAWSIPTGPEPPKESR